MANFTPTLQKPEALGVKSSRVKQSRGIAGPSRRGGNNAESAVLRLSPSEGKQHGEFEIRNQGLAGAGYEKDNLEWRIVDIGKRSCIIGGPTLFLPR